LSGSFERIPARILLYNHVYEQTCKETTEKVPGEGEFGTSKNPQRTEFIFFQSISRKTWLYPQTGQKARLISTGAD